MVTIHGPMRLSLLIGVASLAASPSAKAQQLPPAFLPQSEYESAVFLTPNGDPAFAGPMLERMLSAGDATYLGYGQHAKVGIACGFYYSIATEGAARDWEFYVNRGPDSFTFQGPPDLTDVSQLGAKVRFGLTTSAHDDLAAWARPEKLPAAIAALEWARYLKMPITFQLQSSVNFGGLYAPWLEPYELERHFEMLNDPSTLPADVQLRKNQCMWDVADICDPYDDDPLTAEDSGVPWGDFSFSSPTLADPDLSQAVLGYRLLFQDKVERNITMGMQQLIAMCNDVRYEGLLVGFAIDPEIHLPAHVKQGHSIPVHPDYHATCWCTHDERPFLEDYNPVMIRQFQLYEAERYAPDAGPGTDTNGDGRTFNGDFGQDYTTSGWPGLNTLSAHSTVPSAWDEVDPPRKYPYDKNAPRSKYWQEWCNFRVAAVERFLERIVGAVVAGGCPPDRVFTHQTPAGSSYEDDRAHGTLTVNDPLFNAEWLDDWLHVETSLGMSGLSLYQHLGAGTNNFVYDNLAWRDDSWGIPEFNPLVGGATQAEARTAIRTAWDTRVHVIWPHAWGSAGEPAVDVAATWVNTAASSPNLEGWTRSPGWTVQSGALFPSAAGGDYIELSIASLDSDLHEFFAISLQATSWAQPNAGGAVLDLRLDFQTSNGTWFSHSEPVLRADTPSTGWAVLDLSADPNWTGSIHRLRLYPAPVSTIAAENIRHVYLDRAVMPAPNGFTLELKSLAMDKANTPRPSLSAPLAVALPTNLAQIVTSAYGPVDPVTGNGNPLSNHLAVFGTDADASGQFDDFGPAGNFEPDPSDATVIRQPAAELLGMHKTGRFRRLQLPSDPDLHLSFQVGIQGSTSVDGVRFRVFVRDLVSREVTELHREEARANGWKPRRYVDLSPWSGDVVDLSFEVHGISETTGDASAWRSPRIERAYLLTTDVSGQGQILSDPAGKHSEGRPFDVQAQPAAGWYFKRWDVTGGVSVASATSASTSATMSAAGSLTAVFVQPTTVPLDSVAGEDGWILESATTPGTGATADAGLSDGFALRVGDTAQNLQQLAVVSFASSIPSGSVVLAAELQLTCGTLGGAPVSTLGNARVDLAAPYFGSTLGLLPEDFQASATATNVAQFTTAPVVGQTWTASFTGGLPSIPLGSSTVQLRVYFPTDDDDDGTRDVVGSWSGEASSAGNRPKLLVTYY